MFDRNSFIQHLPKADLHVHLEGTIEPALLFQMAERNGIALPYNDEDELVNAYQFEHLADFLSVYYQGTRAIQQPVDFYDITRQYLRRAASENTLHTEIFIDPQTHLDKGITLEEILEGVLPALEESRTQYGISTSLILCFLRHRPVEESLAILSHIGELHKHFVAIGLAAKERDNPPGKFKPLYLEASQWGWHKTAHAGEEGPAAYIREALEVLHVDRIDHGNSILMDEHLLERARRDQIPLTMCPLSNLHLNVVPSIEQHPANALLQKGLKVTINSDDPSYFGGYMNANLTCVAEAFDWGREELLTVTRNAFDVAYTTEERRKEMVQILEDYTNTSSR